MGQKVVHCTTAKGITRIYNHRLQAKIEFQESDVSPDGKTEVKQGKFIEFISQTKVYFRETCKSQKNLRYHTYHSLKKVRRSGIDQAPHLTQDTNGKVTTSQLDITNESQEVSAFPAGDHKALINRRTKEAPPWNGQ